MKKMIWIGLAVVLALVVAGGALFWYLSTQPFYKSGMVRAGKNLRAPLRPPAQPAGSPDWLMEADIQLHHFADGQGRNALIIHGGPGMPARQPWAGLQSLNQEYRFHYYDQRGSGDSTRPFDRFAGKNMYQNMTTLDKTLGLGAQIADIERIRQILGDEKIILIGHSWGGFLAALYAAEFPEHVAALVLVSPASTLVMPQSGDNLFAAVRKRLPQAEQAGYDAFLKDYLNFGPGLFQKSEEDLIAMNEQFGRYFGMALPGAFPVQGRPGGWMSWAMYVSMGQRHDYRPALKAVSAPVLVLHGTNDLQSEAASGQYADSLPNATFAVIPAAGHFSYEEQPATFAQAVGDFLAGQ